jgi:prepilin-type N-terminal cleavage/methylation domain-containing protein
MCQPPPSQSCAARSFKNRGFTLIELLVVIAIIGVLSSVVIASMNSARRKARDARVLSDFKSLSVAMALYFDDNGTFPPNPTLGSTSCERTTVTTFADAMQPLVIAGHLTQIPSSPNTANEGYCYYDYGVASAGPIIRTDLEAVDASTTGPFGSCRPNPAPYACNNEVASKQYCICGQ